jgi:hypothetical protein
MSGRVPSTLVRALMLLALVVPAGCAWRSGGPGLGLPNGRVLVFPRVTEEQNRPVAEAAADQLAAALRESGHVLTVRQFLNEAAVVTPELWAPLLFGRLQRGGWINPEEAELLLHRFNITTLVATEVMTYDQVWAKHAKFTRVRVEAQAYSTTAAVVLWRARGESETEDKRGRAFQLGMEDAIGAIADAVSPRSGFSIAGMWRSWRR